MTRRDQKLKVFANISLQVSKLSYDPKYKVGAIIVTDDFREVCAIGYNGNYKGNFYNDIIKATNLEEKVSELKQIIKNSMVKYIDHDAPETDNIDKDVIDYDYDYDY